MMTASNLDVQDSSTKHILLIGGRLHGQYVDEQAIDGTIVEGVVYSFDDEEYTACRYAKHGIVLVSDEHVVENYITCLISFI